MYKAETMERAEYRRVRREKIARQKRARRNLFAGLAVTFVLIFAIGVMFGTMLTKAKGTGQDTGYKYYRNIEIASGDSLWSIADTYMDTAHYMTRSDYINEVMELNHMVSDRLIAGQKMIVPYYSEEEK